MKESQHTEWKESWRDEHLRVVCGFANAEGGALVIGRNDKGQVVGVPDAARLLEELPNKTRDLLGIVVEVNLRSKGGKDYLEVVTPAFPSPISYRGHYYQRSGSTLQELKGAALDRFLLRHYGRTWDGSPLPGVAVGHLSTSAIKRFRRLAANTGRLDAAALREPDAKLLTRLKLFEGKYLKRAAVLLFHPDPLVFVTGAFVKIGFFRSQSDLVYHDEVNGDLFSQVQQVQDLLLTKYLKAAVTYEGIVRVERFPVPREALREAVLNALIHRDYMAPVPVQIRVYDDKLVLWNPAVLPDPALSPDKNAEQGRQALPPCHCLFQFYVADGKLSCQLYQRSGDIFLGVPFNIASYALLTMMMAQVCELQPGDFIHTLGDAHLYSNHLEQTELQLSRDTRPLPVMKINPDVKDLFAFRFEDFTLEGYDPHPHIKAPVAI